MNKTVSVWRHRKSGAFLIHAFGTFRGYGGFVGLPPYVELPGSVDPMELGSVVISVFGFCRAVDCHIRQARAFLDSIEDPETRRIRATYDLNSPEATTSLLARRFRSAEVEIPRRYRSWTITPMVYSTSNKAEQGANDRAIRVFFSAGPEALGVALISVLPWKAALLHKSVKQTQLP